MYLRGLILLAVAVVLAGLTAVLARNWIVSERALVPPPPVTVVEKKPAIQVLVAKADILAGSFIKEEQLRWQNWPEDGVAPAYVVEGIRNTSEFVGAVARNRVVAGEPVTDARVVKPGQRGFLAAVLAPSMRAVSVAINATTGISGLIFPGDHVDLILTHSIKRGPDNVQQASETVLEDIRVLALDQRVDQTNGEAPQIAKTVTLEVSPKQVEIVSLVDQMGHLSLSLRSVGREDSPTPREQRHTIDSEVSSLLHPPTAPKATSGKGGGAPPVRQVQVLRGSMGDGSGR